MSNAFSSSPNPPFSSQSGDQYKDANSNSVLSTSHNFALSSWSSAAGSSTWQTTSHPNLTYPQATGNPRKRIAKSKKRTAEEQEITRKTGERSFTTLLYGRPFLTLKTPDLQLGSLWIMQLLCILTRTPHSPTPSMLSIDCCLITYSSNRRRTWNP
jgi:hypothetical protein